jgi:hypothetical protein
VKFHEERHELLSKYVIIKPRFPGPFVVEMSALSQPTLPINRHNCYSEKIMYSITSMLDDSEL